MNQVFAKVTYVNKKRAIVDLDYRFDDSKRNYSGFFTVEVARPEDLYDTSYNRAEAMAKEHDCRLERFVVEDSAPFRVYFVSFDYFASRNFETEDDAKQHAIKKGFTANIMRGGAVIATYSPTGSYSYII